jgi:glycosyltransferase involved in cell wall biosynthesis
LPDGTAVKIYMTGAEWFGSEKGGLSRYFDGLYGAFATCEDVEARGVAFGCPPTSGESWGNSRVGIARRWKRIWDSAPQEIDGYVFDAHFALYGLPLLIRYRRRRILRVVHFHGPWAQESLAQGENRLKARIEWAIEEFVYRRADLIIVLSNAFKELLANVYGVSRSQIRVIRPAVDLGKFKPVGSSSLHLANRVICVRRLEPRMGVDILLWAWKIVAQALPEARLEIYGEGSDRPQLERLVGELRLWDRVMFGGSIDDTKLVECIQSARCMVVPSIALEGFGMVVLESLACGVPTITTDCGGLHEIVSELDESLVVEAGNVDALAKRVLAALRGRLPGPDECRQYAELFSWHRAMSEHVALYREALEWRQI